MGDKRDKGEQYFRSVFPSIKDLPIAEYDNYIWEDRPKTGIIKWLMEQSDVSKQTLSEYLGCSLQYLNNKMTRGSFSIDDLIIAAYACGYAITLTKNTTKSKGQESYLIDIVDYFLKADDEVLVRISDLEKKEKELKKKEYEEKKAELFKMKEKYGFED